MSILYDNIIDSIQDKVNEISSTYWDTDKCKPIFTVSILYDRNIRDKEDQYIILTCTHLSSSFSGVLFPIDRNIYGYDCLLDEMKGLYNRTM